MRDAELIPPPTALDHAQRRLERALDALEARLSAQAKATPSAPPAANARLEGELQDARHRERQLELVAAEASAALGRAAAEVRAALSAEG